MKIEHLAIYVRDLERVKNFYVKYFEGKPNEKYVNSKTGLETYFLSFESGTRLEIMTRPNLANSSAEPLRAGIIHLAFKIGSKDLVDNLTSKLETDGFEIVSYPRTSGDGYYESCVADPEGNFVEIIA